MTIDDEKKYQNLQICWICKEKINNDKDKVRDHSHITGNYRGAAHNQGNLTLKISRKLPIIFHNWEKYDGHIIFKELKNFDSIDIQVIPKTSEKSLSIIINRNIIFLASNHFYESSLDGYASNLEDSDFKHLISKFSADKLEIFKRKDPYPYKWVDSYEKFNNKELPPKECFYSSIKDGKRDKSNGHIYEKEYLDLQNFWKELAFNTFIDFHNHYLKKDVLLLAYVFEKFISTCLKNYNLDPSHYFSAPGLSWDAMLKLTKVELEKISDPDLHLFIEKGIRGGISYINKRYSEANNENCPNYDNEKPKRYINYLGMNNLHGYAMSQYLPYGGLKWIKITSETVNRKLNEKDKYLHGYVLEVDLEFA